MSWFPTEYESKSTKVRIVCIDSIDAPTFYRVEQLAPNTAGVFGWQKMFNRATNKDTFEKLEEAKEFVKSIIDLGGREKTTVVKEYEIPLK